ncbi:MAG TPA: prepilin peptidase [Candidatus Binatia bacterium]|nr:prepilin peptidase [Candidatus Binatia bacterium]
MSLTIGITLAGCLAASYSDVRTRRIPNWLTGLLLLAALVIHGLEGWRSVGTSLAVMAIILVAGTLAYSRGGIGGGDIKLGIVASGLLSYPLCVPFLLYTAIGGGLLALVFLAMRGKARAGVSRVFLMAFAGGPGPAPDKAETLPYAVAFAFGAILVALSQSIAPFLRINL